MKTGRTSFGIYKYNAIHHDRSIIIVYLARLLSSIFHGLSAGDVKPQNDGVQRRVMENIRREIRTTPSIGRRRTQIVFNGETKTSVNVRRALKFRRTVDTQWAIYIAAIPLHRWRKYVWPRNGETGVVKLLDSGKGKDTAAVTAFVAHNDSLDNVCNIVPRRRIYGGYRTNDVVIIPFVPVRRRVNSESGLNSLWHGG